MMMTEHENLKIHSNIQNWSGLLIQFKNSQQNPKPQTQDAGAPHSTKTCDNVSDKTRV